MDCAHSGCLDFYQLDGYLLCAVQAKLPEALSKFLKQQTLLGRRCRRQYLVLPGELSL